MSTRLVLCAAEEVPVGTALQVRIDDLLLGVFNVEGSYHVIDNACTHGPGLLSEGWIEGGVVECDFHQGRFDIATGAVLSPPCTVPVRAYLTTLEEGKVVIDVD